MVLEPYRDAINGLSPNDFSQINFLRPYRRREAVVPEQRHEPPETVEEEQRPTKRTRETKAEEAKDEDVEMEDYVETGLVLEEDPSLKETAQDDQYCALALFRRPVYTDPVIRACPRPTHPMFAELRHKMCFTVTECADLEPNAKIFRLSLDPPVTKFRNIRENLKFGELYDNMSSSVKCPVVPPTVAASTRCLKVEDMVVDFASLEKELNLFKTYKGCSGCQRKEYEIVLDGGHHPDCRRLYDYLDDELDDEFDHQKQIYCREQYGDGYLRHLRIQNRQRLKKPLMEFGEIDMVETLDIVIPFVYYDARGSRKSLRVQCKTPVAEGLLGLDELTVYPKTNPTKTDRERYMHWLKHYLGRSILTLWLVPEPVPETDISIETVKLLCIKVDRFATAYFVPGPDKRFPRVGLMRSYLLRDDA